MLSHQWCLDVFYAGNKYSMPCQLIVLTVIVHTLVYIVEIA